MDVLDERRLDAVQTVSVLQRFSLPLNLPSLADRERRFACDLQKHVAASMARVDLALSAASREMRFREWQSSAAFRKARLTILYSHRRDVDAVRDVRTRLMSMPALERPRERRASCTRRTASSTTRDDGSPGEPPSPPLRRHPRHGLVNEPMRRFLARFEVSA